MPFWRDETWINLAEGDLPVHPFDKDRLEEAKYIMSVGEEVYISSSAASTTIRPLKENEAFHLGPGQFAYILTHETVRIPLDAIGFISINARVKFAGLVNISGFHVDPGYHGRLLFSVFNAGPTAIHLRRGQPIFPLWISDLDVPIRRASFRRGYDRIDPNLITAVSGNYTTAFELDQVIRTLRHEFENAKVDIGSLKTTRNHLLILIAVGTFFLGSIATAGLKLTVDWIRYGNPWFEAVPVTAKLPAASPFVTAPQVPPVQITPTPPTKAGESHG
jgi:dCTP deaminase